MAKDTSGYVIWRTFLDDVAKRIRIAELKKYGVKPLNEESLSAITGGSYGEPSRCPQCGGSQLEVSAQLI